MAIIGNIPYFQTNTKEATETETCYAIYAWSPDVTTALFHLPRTSCEVALDLLDDRILESVVESIQRQRAREHFQVVNTMFVF